MPIPPELAATFPTDTRDRGRQYYHRGVVRIQSVDENGITATVRGAETYQVNLAQTATEQLTHTCSCPAWGNYGVCKHVWATLLAADAQRLLRFDGLPRTRSRGPGAVKPPDLSWKRRLRRIKDRVPPPDALAPDWRFPADRRIVYVVDLAATRQYQRGLVVDLATQRRAPNGEWSPPKQFSLREEQWADAPDALDRQIAQMLTGAGSDTRTVGGYGVSRRYYLEPPAFSTTLRLMCESGRCRVSLNGEAEPAPLEWDHGAPWDLRVDIVPLNGDSPNGGHALRMQGWLRRGDERLALTDAAILAPGLVIAHGVAAPVRDGGNHTLIVALADEGSIEVPAVEVDELLRELHTLPNVPTLDLPETLGIREESPDPRPIIKLLEEPVVSWQPSKVSAEVRFDYAGTIVDGETRQTALFDEENRRIVRRNLDAERVAKEQLVALGFREEYDYRQSRTVPRIGAARMQRAIVALVSTGWIVETDEGQVRAAGDLELEVASGIDWFELRGGASFGNARATLPELLAALRQGRSSITLSDGTVGIMPDAWSERLRALSGVGDTEGDAVRFTRSQVGLLDALLAAMPAAAVDEQFEHARQQLHSFQTLQPADPPSSFQGELRTYQREGLAWLHFLQRFGFGGCLADDMGLGKTVQALALLEERRREKQGVSLVVVPRSLLFNWRQEAARFTPEMRVLIHEGRDRTRDTAAFNEYDIVLITYGTLRRDAPLLAETEFDYVILDEAQAIKNATTETAKASRLLRAKHRLAMSGTPVENRIAELWSLFEFLNPGMLGVARVFKTLGSGEEGESGRTLIARAVRPFILRRTKEQVAPDLPEKLEQTIYVELEPNERKRYDDLRDHYRAALLGRVDKEGIAKSKIQILEALLRLRQAACHSGLLDEARKSESSSKFDLLVPQLAEIVAEGHKALVFSQFTSLLALLKPQLDSEKMVYEYLDGQTKDREERVRRFQTDPECGIFLISLKAGGLGLNLTAADYVYLL
ncbi:MAG TPA: SNF2-related protein, partial [Gemmatimonadaceae bacterium]|nr:SNF2-related protein [Gemmatimonadaceae bacterium]